MPLAVSLIATSFGAGYSRFWPGTMGTLTAVPMAWGLAQLGQTGFLIGTLVVTLVGTWAASGFVRATGREDDQRIVVDEVAGYLVTLALVERSAVNLAIGFVLFRLLDSWKPGPIRWVDDHVGGGFGVMADDLAAGALGAAILVGASLAWRALSIHALGG
jgi:phosphatidylglycerophosphatase A